MNRPPRLPQRPSPPLGQGCRHRLLAQNRVVQVQQCEHGTIHLVLGDLSLRVSEEDFVELQAGLGLAVARLAPSRLPC